MTLRSSLKYITDFLFSEKEWVRDYAQAPDRYIAAGNPTKGVGLTDAGIEILADTTHRQLIVAGNSMAPRAIYDGDRITCVTINDPENIDIKRGTFLAIEVDTSYYETRGKKSKFKNKLRCAILKVPAGISYADFLESVKQVEKSAYLEEYQQELEKKFDEARSFYGSGETLMLSVTYKNGEMHYSFHPVRLIRGMVEKVERYNPATNAWETVRPRPLR